MEVSMGCRVLIATMAAAVVLASTSPVPAQTQGQKRAPAVAKTPWGDPDLQGVWTSDSNSTVPFERPDSLAGKAVLEGDELVQVQQEREQSRARTAPVAGGITGAGPVHWYEHFGAKSARTSLVVSPADGRIPPMIPSAQQREAARAAKRAGRGPADSWEDRSLWDRCISRSLPNVMFPTIYNNNIQIVQAPGYVTVTHEMIHDTRIIPLDGRPHVSPKIRQYLGDARGHWDGNTLVVDVANFTDKTNYRGSGETLHLVERFTRVGPDAIRYEVTVDDPLTFTKPWTAALDLTAQSQLFEYACHEGNYGLSNILSAARAEEREAARTGKTLNAADTRGEER
jgi:hypothetical protein